MSRMRLQAAVSLLHLSTVALYANAIAPRFLRLAIAVQVGARFHSAFASGDRINLLGLMFQRSDDFPEQTSDAAATAKNSVPV